MDELESTTSESAPESDGLVPPLDDPTICVSPTPTSATQDRPGVYDLLKVIAVVWPMELFVGILAATLSMIENGMPAPGAQFVLSPWAVLATAPISIITTIAICWYFACKRYHQSFRDGLYFNLVPGRDVVKSIALGAVAAFIGGGIMALFGSGDSAISELVAHTDPNNPDKVILHYPILALFVLVPIVEEIYYRGFIYGIIKHRYSVRWAIGLTIIWFGLIHAPQLAGDWIGLPVVTAAGALFTWLRYKYDSVVPGLICHLTYNSTLIAVSIVQVMIHNAQH